MAPYRSHQEPEQAKAKKTAGLVADMVRQFADAHAFIRELIQNGIDANATRIEVVVDRTDDGITSVRVIDNGAGMTMDVIENALLVLFRSTKDEDSTKIGKYGVGFMSVFAIEPNEVTVDTFRDGAAYRVRLFPDHSYEIESAAPREGNGTTVILSKRVATNEFESFAEKVFASLSRWCRHAEIPIFFLINDALSKEPKERIRVDTPFRVRSLIEVREQYDDMEIVLGPIAGSGALPKTGSAEDDPTSFAGFYNRGLTLYETANPPADTFVGIRLKVKSSKLHHTLSRDDVRRDHPYHLAITRAGLLADDLQEVIVKELLREAEVVAEGGDDKKYAALLEAAIAPPISLSMQQIPVPLAHPVNNQHAMILGDIHSTYSEFVGARRLFLPATHVRTELSAALAERHVPCVWLATGLARAVEQTTDGQMAFGGIESYHLLVTELPPSARFPNDDALCAMLTEALQLKGLGNVTLGHFHGASALFAVVPTIKGPGKRHVVNRTGSTFNVSKWPKGATLILRDDADAVLAARRASSPAATAHLLARYVVLQGPGLSSKLGEELAVRALSHIS